MKRKMPKQGKSSPTTAALTRRDFLRGAGVVVSSGMLANKTAEGSPPSPAAEILGPQAVPITLRINGRDHKFSLEPRVTLLDALRNHLNLTGAKEVCDRGVCGACTVLMDGKPVYACSILAIEAQGSEITTIEGLTTDGKLHPLMAAFVEHDAVLQCGFCTPGFVMASKALLDKHPNPTEEELEAGLSGNLCRCGAYAGLKAAVLDAAKTMRGGRGHGQM